jgi:hypothetical protein
VEVTVQAGLCLSLTGDPARRGLRDLIRYYAVLFIPVATFLPALTLVTQFQRWDRQSQFPPLLATPISTRHWLVWLLTMSAGPIAIFLVGCWTCLFAHAHPTVLFQETFLYTISSILCRGFYLSASYVPMQCLWSAAITLHFLSRNQRAGAACVKSLLTLLLPGFMGLGLISATEALIGSLYVVNGLKLLILLFLLWSLGRSLRDRLTTRLNP